MYQILTAWPRAGSVITLCQLLRSETARNSLIQVDIVNRMYAHKLMYLQPVYLAFPFQRVACPEKQNNAVIKRGHRFKSPLCNSPTRWPWAIFWTLLNPSVPDCNMHAGELWRILAMAYIKCLKVIGTLKIESITILSFLGVHLLQISLWLQFCWLPPTSKGFSSKIQEDCLYVLNPASGLDEGVSFHF